MDLNDQTVQKLKFCQNQPKRLKTSQKCSQWTKMTNVSKNANKPKLLKNTNLLRIHYQFSQTVQKLKYSQIDPNYCVLSKMAQN